ncbi:MAG: tetratricopeptide repeat protein [Candidatus Acidiferrales bacterium]|jgi:tetratricopeptide (TPR) repeat protein
MNLRHVRIAAAFAAGIFAAAVPFAANAAGVNAAAAVSALPDATAQIQAAQRQFNSGSYSGAISTLQGAVSQNPSSAEAYYWLGRCYYELKDYDNAITAAEKSVTLDPKNSIFHEWLGRIYGGKADRDRSFSYARKVKKEFETAVQLNPANIDARRDLEDYEIQAPWVVGGSKDDAKAQMDAIVALDPVEGDLARAMYDDEALKKPDAAAKDYHDALAANPKKIEPYLDALAFYQKENKAPEMQAAIQQASQVAPNDPRLTYYRGVALVIANNNLADAEKDLKAYLASTPERSDWPSHASAREWLGRLYEAQGKRSEAAEQYRAALQLDPDRKEAKARLQNLEKGSK